MRRETSSGRAGLLGALLLVVAAGGLWGAWHFVSQKPEPRAEVEPALGETTSDIPFTNIDPDAPDGTFVMILQTEGPWKDGPEILDKVLAQVIACDAFAGAALDARYPLAASKRRVVRVQCDRWPGDFEWKRLREIAGKVARVTLEVVGPRGAPRVVPAAEGP